VICPTPLFAGTSNCLKFISKPLIPPPPFSFSRLPRNQTPPSLFFCYTKLRMPVFRPWFPASAGSKFLNPFSCLVTPSKNFFSRPHPTPVTNLNQHNIKISQNGLFDKCIFHTLYFSFFSYLWIFSFLRYPVVRPITLRDSNMSLFSSSFPPK